MKKKIKWILGCILGAILIFCLVVFIYFRFFFTLDLFEEGPTKKVNLSGWEKLERGMTKAQVAALLGDSVSTFGPGQGTIGGTKISVAETWQYNWKVGISIWGEVHPKSYIVQFGPDGRLASWREPLEENIKPEQSVPGYPPQGVGSPDP